MEKIDITARYPEENEIRKDNRPYKSFYDMLNQTFDLKKIKSFCDVGCSTGHLLHEFKTNNSEIELCGYEFFQYHKDAAAPDIKNFINIVDLREELNISHKYDLVNCTEVGEHIDKEFAEIFLKNLKNLTNKFIIMSWSDTGGKDDPLNDPLHQHLNPLKYEQFVSLMKNNGFILLENQTKELLRNSYRPYFYEWWRKSLTIWRVEK